MRNSADQFIGIGFLKKSKGRRGGRGRTYRFLLDFNVSLRRQPCQAAVQFHAGIILRRCRRGARVKELVDHPPLLALIDVFQFDDDLTDLPGQLGRKLIEYGIGRGRIEARH